MHPILYLTSELSNRDWDSRLLMADHAVQAGFSVVIGQQWAVLRNYEVLPRGLILFKTMNLIQGNAMAHLKNAGHLVVGMDEESLPLAVDRPEATDLLERACAEPSRKYCDVFFANSPLHKDMVERAIPPLAPKTMVTGNPRIDLLTPALRPRYAAAAAALREKYGPYILFNSNTASRNSIWNKKDFLDIQVKIGALHLDDKVSVARFEEQMAFEEDNAVAFEDMLKWCAANVPSHAIVVRPHPSEGLDYWTKFAADTPRVTVAWNTPHIPYMMGADIVVHTNCTTGIEAAVLGKATVNLMPRPDSYWSKLYLAPAASPTFLNVEDAKAAVTTYVATGGGPLVPTDAHRAALARYYPCMEKYDSAQNCARLMGKLLLKHGAGANRPPRRDIFMGRYVRKDIDPVFRKKFEKSFENAVADIKTMRRSSGLTHAISFDQVDDGLFLMSPQA